MTDSGTEEQLDDEGHGSRLYYEGCAEGMRTNDPRIVLMLRRNLYKEAPLKKGHWFAQISLEDTRYHEDYVKRP